MVSFKRKRRSETSMNFSNASAMPTRLSAGSCYMSTQQMLGF